MATQSKETAVRLSVRVSKRDRDMISEAAGLVGQSIEEFCESSVLQAARRVLGFPTKTSLSADDAQMLLAAFDDTTREPNAALKRAARLYKRSGIKTS